MCLQADTCTSTWPLLTPCSLTSVLYGLPWSFCIDPVHGYTVLLNRSCCTYQWRVLFFFMTYGNWVNRRGGTSVTGKKPDSVHLDPEYFIISVLSINHVKTHIENSWFQFIVTCVNWHFLMVWSIYFNIKYSNLWNSQNVELVPFFVHYFETNTKLHKSIEKAVLCLHNFHLG